MSYPNIKSKSYPLGKTIYVKGIKTGVFFLFLEQDSYILKLHVKMFNLSIIKISNLVTTFRQFVWLFV